MDPVGQVKSPNGAAFSVEQELLDERDEGTSLCVTVHNIDGHSHCNIWHYFSQRTGIGYQLVPHRLLDEHVIHNRQPRIQMLQEQLMRCASDDTIRNQVADNAFFRTGIRMLNQRVQKLVDKED